MSAAPLDFGAHDTLYATHALHAFAAKCPPPLARWAIDRYSEPGELVVDPMAGSGTTLVEAGMRGRDAVGADIDPLARLIAKAKSTPVPLADLDAATAAVLAAFADRNAEPPLAPPALRDLDRWFLPGVTRDLLRLKWSIGQAPATDDGRDLLYAAFSSLITARTSVANVRDLVHSRHHYRAHPTPPDIGALFARRLRQVRRQMSAFLDACHAAPRPATAMVLADDARALSLAEASADLVFSSPPYCNALDYTRAHTFSVAWLGDVLGIAPDAYVRLGRAYIGSERGSRGGPPPHPPTVPLIRHLIEAVAARDERRGLVVARYFADMARVMAEIGRVLKPGGRLVLVVCPSHIRKVEIPTHDTFVAMGEALSGSGYRFAGEEMIERTLDDRRRIMPYLQEAFGRRMRTEYVVVLRKVVHRDPADPVSSGRGDRP